MSDLQLKLDLLVLDYLLSRRGLPTDVVLKFGSLLPQGTIEHLEGQTQARLMLRLLVDGHANGLSEDTITCLNIISSLPVRDGTATSFRPAPQLIKQVRAYTPVCCCAHLTGACAADGRVLYAAVVRAFALGGRRADWYR